MAKEIVIDIISGSVSVSSDIQTGDTVAVIKAKNLPEEWLSDSTYVYALISQGENQVLNLMKNETENSKTVKKCGVQPVFTADNKAFKIVIFGTDVVVGEDGTVSGSYRYVSAPVMVSVGEGIESLTAEILPDKNGYEAISSFLISLQSAVEAEKVRAANEDKREEAEEARAGAEEIRASAEFERAEAETERAEAESRRIESESIRADNEELRIGNEGQRIQNETARIEEESKRESSENAREEAETARETAELGRSAMIESRYFATAEEYEEFIDNIENRNTKIFKLSWGGTEEIPFITEWLITGWLDASDGTNSRTQVKISLGSIYTRRYIVWEYDDDGGTTRVDKWSDWLVIVDNSMLESRLQRFADEFTIDVDQSYNANSENAQSGKAVAEAVAKIVNGSPEALDTLYELAKALGNDENFSTTVMAEIGKKADKASLEEAESDIARILDGRASVGKATRDSRGNYIHTYYATKEELESKADKTEFSAMPVAEKIFKSTDGILLTEPELDSCIEHKIYRLSDETGDIKGWLFCTNFTGGQECGQVLIDDKGEIYARHQRIVDDEGIIGYIWNDWEKYAKEKYVTSSIDAKIGDIETSLENIINKYGLGGEAV